MIEVPSRARTIDVHPAGSQEVNVFIKLVPGKSNYLSYPSTYRTSQQSAGLAISLAVVVRHSHTSKGCSLFRIMKKSCRTVDSQLRAPGTYLETSLEEMPHSYLALSEDGPKQ